MNAWHQEKLRIPLVDHARAYARKGWRVMPLHWPTEPGECACSKGGLCRCVGKHPTIENWAEAATTSATQIDIWWSKWPLANIGIATGSTSGIVVLDIDGTEGLAALQGLFLQHEKPPPTPTSVTGSGGRHILWRHPGSRVGNSVRLMPGIDVRGDGGLIVAAPSLHGSGARYEWHKDAHPARVAVQEAPAWVLRMLAPRRRPTTRGRGDAFDLARIPPIADGTRNDRLFRIVCRLVTEHDPAAVLEYAHAVNLECCKPPLPDAEVEAIVAGAVRRYGG